MDKRIRRVADRIVTRFRPVRIIRFGTHARGDAGSDGGVDLLAIMPVGGSKREELQKGTFSCSRTAGAGGTRREK